MKGRGKFQVITSFGGLGDLRFLRGDRSGRLSGPRQLVIYESLRFREGSAEGVGVVEES